MTRHWKNPEMSNSERAALLFKHNPDSPTLRQFFEALRQGRMVNPRIYIDAAVQRGEIQLGANEP